MPGLLDCQKPGWDPLNGQRGAADDSLHGSGSFGDRAAGVRRKWPLDLERGREAAQAEQVAR